MRMNNQDKWIKAGLIATILIVLTVPVYLVKKNIFETADESQFANEPFFVGKDACVDCHKVQFELWKGSDHDLAMDYATDSTVLGNFNNVQLTARGFTHQFYKRDEKFFVRTDGPKGKPEEFEVKYTFGYHPLQQYLVEFPGGRLQTLPLTWDTISKSWYHMADAVYPEEEVNHRNWLHWTNLGQNWNGMCADCHSTNLKKGFDIKTETFNTTWSEIDVSCEACHGPSSEHIKWANLPEMARPQNVNAGLVVQTSNIDNRRYVDLCARCHTRRSALHDYDFDWADLLDQMIPELVREPLYYPDGQILEEDYVFGSFTQSRMYMEGVRCNDCHDVHSGKRILDGNALCLQCHRSDVYDSYKHHFHKYEGNSSLKVIDEFGIEQEVGSGVQCINCHMPGRYYMGVDYRRDHSFRVPRPDLSDEMGTPNACTQCHANQSNAWATSYMKKWYGESTNPHYGIALAAGTHRLPGAFEKLVRLSNDDLYPVIVRATALSLLGENYADSSKIILKNNLKDVESLIRYTAVNQYPLSDLTDMDALVPLLNDPVRAVRFEAAIKLSQVPREQFPAKSRYALDEALLEYKKAMEYSGDFAASRLNLGNYYNNLGEPLKAIEQFIAAIRIDDQFYPAKVNLAMIYNQQGENDKAELLFRDVLKSNPGMSEIYYSLGLLLAEREKYQEAANMLQKASELLPDRIRIYYNLGLIYQYLNENQNAEQVLMKGLNIQPENFDLLYALADFYLKQKNFSRAKFYAEKLVTLYPQSQVGTDILKMIPR
ncbi:MAG: tetratricopeptide repeat protein [Bacteroidales bacterium]|nr:tetratricopeptide repeat protein [Bacteroidales bacterium]